MKVSLPVDTKFDDPTIVYSLFSPIRSKLLYFDKFIHNLNNKGFLQINLFYSNDDASGKFEFVFQQIYALLPIN